MLISHGKHCPTSSWAGSFGPNGAQFCTGYEPYVQLRGCCCMVVPSVGAWWKWTTVDTFGLADLATWREEALPGGYGDQDGGASTILEGAPSAPIIWCSRLWTPWIEPRNPGTALRNLASLSNSAAMFLTVFLGCHKTSKPLRLVEL